MAAAILRSAAFHRCLLTAQLCGAEALPAVALAHQTARSVVFRGVSSTSAVLKPKKGKSVPPVTSQPPSNADEHAVEAPSLKKIEQRAERVVEWFQDELSKLRGGSASAGMLDSVPVQAYGDTVPLSQLAQVALKQGNTLVVSPFDPSLCADIDKAIRTTDLGLNPSVNNGSLRVPVPKASKETRAATVKQLTKLEETAKQRVRKVRQTGIDRARKYGKEDGVSQDEAHALEQDIDTMAKRQLEQLAEMAKARKAEIAGE